MDLAKNLENNMHGKKSLEIPAKFEGNIIYDNGLFNILNSNIFIPLIDYIICYNECSYSIVL